MAEETEVDQGCENGVGKLTYADSRAAINYYLSKTVVWELCSSPVRKEERQQANDGREMKTKEEAGELRGGRVYRDAFPLTFLLFQLEDQTGASIDINTPLPPKCVYTQRHKALDITKF